MAKGISTRGDILVSKTADGVDLNDIFAEVQQVMLQDKVWYRVRLGPFKKMDEVNNVRSELAKQGVDANVVKKD